MLSNKNNQEDKDTVVYVALRNTWRPSTPGCS